LSRKAAIEIVSIFASKYENPNQDQYFYQGIDPSPSGCVNGMIPSIHIQYLQAQVSPKVSFQFIVYLNPLTKPMPYEAFAPFLNLTWNAKILRTSYN